MVAIATIDKAPQSGPIVDPEFRGLIPPLTPEEVLGLEASILTEGVRNPLVVWGSQNILLDGHHRLEICGRHGLPYKTVAREFPDRDAAKAWVIQTQLGRRNLTPYARAELGLKLAECVSAQASARKADQMRLANAVRHREEVHAQDPPSSLDLSNIRQIENVDGLDALRSAAEVAGLSRATIHKAKVIAQKAPEEVKQRLRRGDTTIHGEYQRLVGTTTAARIVASTENEWYTPAKYIEAAREVLGGIDLDPASSDRANQTVKAARFYIAADDGLDQPWSGRVWLNPPYGRLAGEFTGRLVREYTAGEVEAAILLVNAYCTDTDWFQPLSDYRLCFTDHRIDFDSAGREKNTTSTHGSVFVYLGPENEAFQKRFSEFGAVVGRIPPADPSSAVLALAA